MTILMKVFALGVALCLAACDNVAPKQNSQSSSEVGRWTIIHSPHVQRDTMLLDTVTGKTWLLVKMGNAEDASLAWERAYMTDDPNAPAPMNEPKKAKQTAQEPVRQSDTSAPNELNTEDE